MVRDVLMDAESDKNTFGCLSFIVLELLNLKHKEIFFNKPIFISRPRKVVWSSNFGQRRIFGR